MNRCRGSAIVLSMLLLVILSALGMYAVSVPIGTGESAGRHHRAAVARNMARAGANAAIARFPLVSPGDSPYVRRIPVGPTVTGRYTVTSRKAGAEIGTGSAAGSGFVEYDLLSVGSVTDLPDGEARVVARIRYGPDLPGPKARILKWEESASR
ncbi:MAG: hypothetical protein Q8O78_02745 [Candidatus Deferrimicrobium sp.]|nr:hypothetical protein [Candidatus Deferrimicrobium sp.]